MTTTSTSVSAPGKVLMTGGYLVLDRQFHGLVVAIDARFHVRIDTVASDTAISQSDQTEIPISVKSPQFTDGSWDFVLSAHNNQLTIARALNSPPNPFVETTLSYAMHVVAAKVSKDQVSSKLVAGLEITILADNDFYSQSADLERRGLELSIASLQSLPPHNPTHGPIAKVHKTGLGSSAAMVTALSAAILCHFGVAHILKNTDQSLDSSMQRIYNLAQICHCVAQGKIGSGFDVSAAVIGSHGYRRFSPSLLDPVFEAAAAVTAAGENGTEDQAAKLASRIVATVDQKWDYESVPFEMPHGLSIVLADVAAGSNTPKLVSKVLAWRKAQPETSEQLWSELGSLNDRVKDLLLNLARLHKTSPESYMNGISRCAKLTASEWPTILSDSAEVLPVVSTLIDIHQTFTNVREYLRRMSDLADAPIEPPSQTRLLDACMTVPGVLMAGVPGAGGFDAIFCIVLSDTARKTLQNDVWMHWQEARVAPLLRRDATCGLILQS